MQFNSEIFATQESKVSANCFRSRIKETNKRYMSIRAYHVLEEINVKPNVWYLAKVRNKEENA
jgi:hypothetical protein